jgi:CTP synthase
MRKNLPPDDCHDIDGILVPSGFGARGVDGKIAVAGYAREHNVPYMGICLGMQVAVIEFARNVLGIENANLSEFSSDCTPVIGIMAAHDAENMGAR